MLRSALLFAFFATSGLGQTRSATPAIVFVHGRNQPIDSLEAVRAIFLGSFDRAQKQWLGEAIVPAGDLGFVWYADAIDPNSDRIPTSGSCNFAEDMSRAAEDMSTAAEARRGDIRDDLMGLATSLHLDGLGLRILTADTYKYLTSTVTRCEADSRLAGELSNRGFSDRLIIVVAHSMGGIVSFASIKRNAESLTPANRFSVLRLVTIGTQVGVPVILKGLLGSYVQTPVAEPLSIASWRNFINQGDKLAFPARASFKATNADRLPVDIRINTPGERHSAANYLADRRVVRAILWAWCTSQLTSKPAKCAVVEEQGDVR